MTEPGSRWAAEQGYGSGADYDARWERLADEGRSVHGEADFVGRFRPTSVLDAGCGTGRVAIELAARGVDVVGVDLDPTMLAEARSKAPALTWIEASLTDVDVGRRFDVVLTAGNVMIFLQPGTEGDVVRNLAGHLADGGRLISGFELHEGYDIDRYDADCAESGLVVDARFATWDGDPWTPAADYAVSVHRRQDRPARTA